MSVRKRGNGSRIFGLLLMLMGIAWILQETGFVYFVRGSLGAWVLFVFGLFLMISGFSQNSKRMAFWGTVMALGSSIHLLQDYRIIHPYLIDVWPLYLSSVGVAFLATIFIKPTDLAALIPGGIFLLSGVYIFMEVNGFFRYEIMYNSNRILAIFLILIGSLLLWKNPRNKEKKESESVPSKESAANSGKSNI